MLNEFQKDLAQAKYAEQLVLDYLSSLTSYWSFQDVSNQREYFYRGDIKATAEDGRELFIEVKDDSRIADTHRVLCEEENYIKDGGYFIKGGMYNQTDIYVVVSQQERKIYIIDFKVLQQIYRKGEFKVIPHAQQDTYCYLLDLYIIKRYKGLIDILEY